MQQITPPNLPVNDQFPEIAKEFDKNQTISSPEEEDDYGDFEFSFVRGEPKSPVSADDIFQDGQIRPIFPFCENAGNSDEATSSSRVPPVRKLFFLREDQSPEPEHDDIKPVAEGPFCVWSGKSPAENPVPEMSRKSNSTGFSKLWRVKDLLVRSHSDGKDSFVFLTGKSDENKVGNETTSSDEKKKKKKVSPPKINVGKGETTSYGEKKGKKTAYEVLYGKKMEEKEKKGGKSYLPYKQDLVGFFTNVNGMSRNVHPY